jgi:hypothetical protein
VQQPLGKALVLFGVGHMSVSANHLASQGTTTRSFVEPLQEIFQAGEQLPAAQLLFVLIDRLLGSAVTVVNLGFSSELAEIILLLRILAASRAGDAGRPENRFAIARAPQAPAGDTVAAKGWAGAARLLRNGEVLFNDNQVVQSFLDGERSFTLSAGLLVSFDDLSVADHHFSSQVDFVGDFSVASLLAMGWSLRCSSNRFEETILHSLFSAVTIGLYNSTAHNQGTHCFRVSGLPALTVDGPNRSLVQLFSPLACGGCLQPPYAGLSKRALDVTGDEIIPELRTMAGISGLWFGDRMEIELGAEVDEVTLGFVGNDVRLSVDALGAGSATANLTPSAERETVITLRGDRLSRIAIAGGSGRTILSRLCTSRPQALPGGDSGAPNVLTLGD